MALLRKPRRQSYYLCLFIIPMLLSLYTLNVFLKSSPSEGIPIETKSPELFKKIILKEDDQEKLPNEITLSDDCKKLCPYSSQLTNVTVNFDVNHIIRHFPSFICPQNFRNLADWVYDWPDQFHEINTKTTDQGQRIAPCLPNGSIIYVRQWAIDPFFEKVYKHLQNNFVLITGEGDGSAPNGLELLDAPDSKIIHWFGQNGQYDVSKTKKFTHIPIGLNCYEMADGIQTIYSQHPNNTVLSVFGDLDEPFSYILPQDVANRVLTTNVSNKDLVLINFFPKNDGSGLRKRIFENMCSETEGHSYTFVKCISKEYGVNIAEMPKIYERNRQYPFWLSPRGSGLDCHRTWEALYLDIIPIVWNGSLNSLYEKLPVLIINDFTDLNEKFLYEKLYEISKNKLSKDPVYQYEKLRHAYWRRLILEKSRYKEKNDIYQRKNQCWRAKSIKHA